MLSLRPRRHPLTLPADLLIENSSAACLGHVSCFQLLGIALNSQAAELEVGRCRVQLQ